MSGGFVLEGLDVGYRARRGRLERRVLAGLEGRAAAGDLTVLVGPNGAGKSTLLRTLAGLQPPLGGRVMLGGADLAQVSVADLARRLAVVLTERDVPGLLTVRELVGLGRYQHTGWSGRLLASDQDAVTWALEAVGGGHLAGRRVAELSDGERQRVFVAHALAQEPLAIVLDEPTAFLDVTARVAVMALLRRLAREREMAIVMSTHDLELALRVADQMWLVMPGRGLVRGTPEELTLDGSLGAAFSGSGLAFDPAAGVFAPHSGGGGTARVDAPGLQRALVARALGRESWEVVDAGPADLCITWTGAGYSVTYEGASYSFATLAELTAWSRIGTRSDGSRTFAW